MNRGTSILAAGLVLALAVAESFAADPALGHLAASNAPVSPSRSRPAMPPLPVAKSPTTRFRELLAASPAEREALLSRKSPAARALIESKLKEFSLLRPDEREIRLRLAQLHDTLRPLLAVPAERRDALLALVAAEDQSLVQERLAAWDALPEEGRRDFLESEQHLSMFLRQPETDPRKLVTLVESLPAESKASAEDQLKRWLALTPEQRSRKAAAFSRFFDLTARERKAALEQLSDPELRQIEKTLADFSTLEPAERERCIRGFRQFEALAPAEREQFLRNAERWKELSPNDRAAWRRLVRRTLAPPPLPPLPARDSMLATTNR
jgi:hypothetical protein